MKQLFGYLEGVVEELKRVDFPSRDQVIRHTAVVAISVIILIIFLTVVDYFFTYLDRLLIQL